ncbi:chromate transporter [Paenibacillus xanthanilyticus]|uniref:Chromate transporter n=1 Tax=Paenibacillus xanthanilyticus TaxID=1783531 RepID=A0ABV8K5U2_9BACL
MGSWWALFLVFLKAGLLSFGGGYSVMPMIEREVTDRGWMASGEYLELTAVAGLSPGPMATNTATMVGYHTAGIPGAIAATAGIVLPSLCIIVLAAAFCAKLSRHKWVRSSFYGLRPIVTGLILYAALYVGFIALPKPLLDWSTFATLMIAAGSLLVMMRYKWHPFKVIVAAAVAGIVLF